MSSDNDWPPSRRAAPHIRLNSGVDDLRDQPTPEARRPPSSRSLTASSRPGTAPSINYAHAPAESAEMLLPPSKSRPRRAYDEESPMPSPTASGFQSRRTSVSSEASRDGRYGPFVSPFDDSRPPSRASSDDGNVNTQTVSEKYNILPSAGLLLFPEDVEKDDAMHTPDPNERDRLVWSELFSKRGLMNIGALAFITIGILILFIGYPILTFVQDSIAAQSADKCGKDPLCLRKDVPLMKNLRRGLIDPDTPDNVKTRKGDNGKIQKLAFSDEFSTDGRTFYEGDDPYFQGVDIWYGVTQDLEWYDPDAITTANGTLAIRFDAFKNHGLNYRSGMLQSWNMLCFKGGYLEASISLPGRGDTIGFWPGFWAMGNLGRAGYAGTTDGMWPYSYHDECDAGITKNQSDPDGLSYLPGMKLPACTCEGEDHPSPGISRSAPEIDALEASVAFLDPPDKAGVGDASQSFQVAPFDLFSQPNLDYTELYDTSITKINTYAGGVYQQACSGLTFLNNDWYDGKAYQTYGFEYEPGDSGYVTWNVGDVKTWKMDAKAVGPNGNIGQRVIPEEPMTIIANFGMSNGFSALNLTGLQPLIPAYMRIDYIRIYQDEDGEMTCDPKGYPSVDYIANHPEAYENFNKTHWVDIGHEFPKNSYVDNCKIDSAASQNRLAKRDLLDKRAGKKKVKRSWMSWGS